jgi:hypothetical protein
MTSYQKSRRQLRRPNAIVLRGATGLEHLLTELAYLLLPHGMTPRRFSDLARSAFVQAAADISRLHNGRVNHSRVAAQTGLTRADVRRLLDPADSDTAQRGQTALEKVMDGWRTDREFITRTGHARRLRILGQKGSFLHLVKKHGGDVPHRAVLDELRRIGAVTESAGTVQLRGSQQFRKRLNFAFLAPVVPALVDGLRIAGGLGSNTPPSIHRLSLPAKSEVDLTIMRDRCRSGVQSMLEGLAHSLGPQITIPSRKGTPSHWVTVTVLLAENRAKRPDRSR